MIILHQEKSHYSNYVQTARIRERFTELIPPLENTDTLYDLIHLNDISII